MNISKMIRIKVSSVYQFLFISLVKISESYEQRFWQNPVFSKTPERVFFEGKIARISRFEKTPQKTARPIFSQQKRQFY